MTFPGTRSPYYGVMSMSLRRAGRRARTRGKSRPPVFLTIEGARRTRLGSRSLYHQGVAERRIDRDAWARLLADLINVESRGKKATFARLVGVDPKSINLWLNQGVDVSEDSVRRIARALGRAPRDMLIQVGYYSSAELGQPPDQPDPVEPDPVIAAIRQSPLPNRKKQALIQRIYAQREQQREREMADVQWLIEQESA